MAFDEDLDERVRELLRDDPLALETWERAVSTSASTLQVGDTLYGFCEGYFGRDSYSEKTVEAVGRDWVVAREEGGGPVFAHVAPARLAKHRDEELGR